MIQSNRTNKWKTSKMCLHRKLSIEEKFPIMQYPTSQLLVARYGWWCHLWRCLLYKWGRWLIKTLESTTYHSYSEPEPMQCWKWKFMGLLNPYLLHIERYLNLMQTKCQSVLKSRLSANSSILIFYKMEKAGEAN